MSCGPASDHGPAGRKEVQSASIYGACACARDPPDIRVLHIRNELSCGDYVEIDLQSALSSVQQLPNHTTMSAELSAGLKAVELWFPVYPVIFIDRINVKIRDGQVANRPIYIALAGRGRWQPRHPRPVGRGRWGGRKTLGACAHRAEEPWRERCLHGRLRMAERAARLDWSCAAGSDHADLCRAPAASQFPVRGPVGLGQDREGPETGVHRVDGGPRRGAIPGVR